MSRPWQKLPRIPSVLGVLAASTLAAGGSPHLEHERWRSNPSFRLGLYGSYDSNPQLLFDALPNDEHVWALEPTLTAHLRLDRKTSFWYPDHTPEKFLQLDFAAEAAPVFQDGAKEIEPFEYSFWTSFDYDLFVCHGCYLSDKSQHKTLKRVSWGVSAEHEVTEVDGSTAWTSKSGTLAAMLTWRSSPAINNRSCELDNLLLTFRQEAVADKQQVAAAFDRDGSTRAYGFEQTFYQRSRRGPAGKDHEVAHICPRRGPFYEYLPGDYRSWRLGFEYRTEDTDGTEFDSRLARYYIGASWPLSWEPKDRGVLAIDAQLEYARSSYSNPSQYDPFVPRNDDIGYAEVAARRYMKGWSRSLRARVDARVGLAGTFLSSDIAVYKYQRLYAFAGLDVQYSPRRNRFLPQGGGSQTVQPSSRPGASTPVVSTRLPPTGGA